MNRARHHVERVIGTAVSIDVRDPIGPTAIDDVVAWLHRVDALFSTHRLDSQVSRFALGELDVDQLDADVLDILGRCEDLFDDTDGAFDAWSVPAPNGTHFDPSGVVKGWAIERATAILETHDVSNFCITAGGDVALRGEPEPGRSWRVGVRHPDRADAVAILLELSGRGAVATSGSYERGAHIIDPRTGAPTADLASVTIIGTDLGADLTTVDALATAVYVLGVDGLPWLLEQHPELDGVVITRDDEVLCTPGIHRYLSRSAALS